MAAKRTRKGTAPGKEPAPQSEPDLDAVQAVRLIQHLASIVNNTVKGYWLSAEDRATTMGDVFAFLDKLLSSHPQITLRIHGDGFTVNGRDLEYRDALVRALIAHLTDVAVDNFYFVQGLTADEFSKFCEVLSGDPAELRQLGEFGSVLERFQIQHVRTKKLIYREIADAEVVLSQGEFDRMTAAGGTGPGEGPGKGGDAAPPDHPPALVAGDILAFLKGSVSTGDTTITDVARELASDPERMAQLILQAAEIRETSADVDAGETLGDFIVACLRRTADGLRADPTSNTPKGRKRTARNLVLLEEEIVRRMREMSEPECTEEDLEKITSAAEEITDEVKIDALAEEYMARREASAEAESRLLDAIRDSGAAAGGGPVLDKLAQRGLSPAGWQELVVKSGIGARPEWSATPAFASNRILEAISHLDSLLDTMEKEFLKLSKARRDEEARRMVDILEGVSTQIRHLTTQTGLAIQSLLENIHGSESAVQAAESGIRQSGQDLPITRKDALGAISRILGEISEPVELIRTALDMMKSKAFEDSPELQKTVVHLAGENTELIKSLIDHLRRIAGEAPPPRHE